MSDQYDLNNLLNKKKDPATGVPILGQQEQVPVFSGLPLGPNQVLPTEAILELTDKEFRELFIAVVVGMMGGMYVPPERLDDLKGDGTIVPAEASEDAPEPSESTSVGVELDPED